MDKAPIIILRDILKTMMGLDSQQIYLYNQDFKIPTTSGLFVVLQYISGRPWSSNNIQTPVMDGGMTETITSLVKEVYQVNLMSKNTDSRDRKEEAMMAFRSSYAEQQKELYQFTFSLTTEDILNISEVEGAGMLNRFVFNINVNAWYSITRSIDYYDEFTNTLTTN